MVRVCDPLDRRDGHGRAAPIDLEATHSSALEFVSLEDLQAHAIA
jgi:uncharacterized protein (DUF2237 family)